MTEEQIVHELTYIATQLEKIDRRLAVLEANVEQLLVELNALRFLVKR